MAVSEGGDVSNAIYDIARRGLLNATLNWVTTNLVLIAWKGTPRFVATDATVAAVKSHGAIDVSWSLAITGKAVTADGTAQTDPALLPKVPTGSQVTHFVLARKEAVLTNSMPILFIDDAFGLPFVPNGLDVPVQPDWLAQRGWFRP
jgi:hypothetical protein